jgi:hypothetical protein
MTHSFAAERTYQLAAKTMERPQLFFFTALQPSHINNGSVVLTLVSRRLPLGRFKVLNVFGNKVSVD